MERIRLPFADARRIERSGAFVLDDKGTLALRLSPVLEGAAKSGEEISPLHIDVPERASRLLSALSNGVRASRAHCELVTGAFVVRGYLDAWVRLTLRPGSFDPDIAWDFVLAANEATIEA